MTFPTIGPRPSNREIPCRICGGTVEVAPRDNVACIANVNVPGGWQVICRECAVEVSSKGIPFVVMDFGMLAEHEEVKH